jgi:hypothetical protein
MMPIHIPKDDQSKSAGVIRNLIYSTSPNRWQ